MTSEVYYAMVEGWHGENRFEEHGQDLFEWISLIHHDYDHVDRMLIDLETIGGG